MKLTLKTIGLTNSEFCMVDELVSFLMWMKQESTCIPERFDGEECEHLMVRYIQHIRRETDSEIKRRKDAQCSR